MSEAAVSQRMTEPGWTVDRNEEGTRLDKFLAHPSRLGSRARAALAIERGKVYLDGVITEHAAQKLSAGSVVRIWMDRPGSARRRVCRRRADLDIVYEDDQLLVINKPAGVLTVPLERKPDVQSVANQIATYMRSAGRRRPFVVHRIDQDTSGLVIFVKDVSSQRRFQAQFRRQEPARIYWAVVYGHPSPASGTWRDRLVWDTKALIQRKAAPGDPEGTDAISDYRILERFRDASLLEVQLRTGRRNQIRVQAHLHGHALIGEKRYTQASESRRVIACRRHALHARRLAFLHPLDNRPLEFEVPPPRDFLELLERLRRRK